MFIEKISDKSLEKFVGQYDVSIEKIERDNKRIYILGWTESMGPNPEFHLEDFDAKMLTNFQYFNNRVKDDWRIFLYTTFGEEYKTAIENHFHEETKKVMNKLIKKSNKKENKNEF